MANKDLIIQSDMDLENKTRMMLMCVAQEQKVEMTRRLAPFNISMQQLQILHSLSFAPDGVMSVNQIKEVMVDESSNVSRALNKLADQGLVIKTRSAEDQRTVFIAITAEGHKTHREADKKLMTLHLPLSNDEMGQLYTLLQRF